MQDNINEIKVKNKAKLSEIKNKFAQQKKMLKVLLDDNKDSTEGK